LPRPDESHFPASGQDAGPVLATNTANARNFAVADQIRTRLAELGVTLEDRPGGTGWRVG